MVVPTDTKHIVRDPDVYGGKPCISGHRIAVHDVAVWHRRGQTPEAIAQDFGLTLAQVYAALAYYYDRQDEIDGEIATESAEIKSSADADTSALAQRLRQAGVERRESPHD